jgi:hypothetical protein
MLTTAASGKPAPPPVFHMLAPGERRSGESNNPVWFAQCGHKLQSSFSQPMIVKLLREQHLIATELACALAGAALGCPVPGCALVVADRDQLPELPMSVQGDRVLLFGSYFHAPDAFMAEVLSTSADIEHETWTRVCATTAGPRGAALDELLANPDRHTGNVLFDGNASWLIDHDLALQPASQWATDWADQMTRQNAVAYVARVNLLASQMLTHQPAHREWLTTQPSAFSRQKRQLAALSQWVATWRDPDSRVEGLWQLTSLILDLISTRLPALAHHLSQRVPHNESGTGLQWTSPTPRP